MPDGISNRGPAEVLPDRHRHGVRYVPGLCWYRWSGHHRTADGSKAVLRDVGERAEALVERDPTGRPSSYTADGRGGKR
ncbi:hypothetical protein [Streptomyces sp. NPDC058632]|uniref:hypothetical protein n=1 Tax=unclassified Streptomyces TaxID=2593676 RepID=UPI003647A796